MPDTIHNPFRVTLLGTGAPPPSLERFGPSTLVKSARRNSFSMPGAAPCSGCISSAFHSAISPGCF